MKNDFYNNKKNSEIKFDEFETKYNEMYRNLNDKIDQENVNLNKSIKDNYKKLNENFKNTLNENDKE
jgi:hypothetical protein